MKKVMFSSFNFNLELIFGKFQIEVESKRTLPFSSSADSTEKCPYNGNKSVSCSVSACVCMMNDAYAYRCCIPVYTCTDRLFVTTRTSWCALYS